MQFVELKRYLIIGSIVICMVSMTNSIVGQNINQDHTNEPSSDLPFERHTLLTMDFEGEWTTSAFSNYQSPEDWTIQGITQGHQEYNNKLTHYWSQITTDLIYTHQLWPLSPISEPYVYEGNTAVGLWGNDGNREPEFQGNRSNEWLITPSLNFSNYFNISLTFQSIYVPTQWYTMPFPLLIGVDNEYLIKSSIDDGVTWKQRADLRDSPYKIGINVYNDVYNKYDHPITIDLDTLTGKDNVLLAWNYVFNGGISDLWMIDDIKITGLYDDIPPDIDIIKPQKDNIYVLDATVIPKAGKTMVIGPVEIIVDPTDYGTGTEYVEFYMDNTLQYTDSTYPYSWNWNQFSFGTKTIKAVAHDYAGNTNQAMISIFKIF